MTNWILSALESRSDRDWIGGVNSHKIAAIADQTFLELAKLNQRSIVPKILLCESEPGQFLGRFMAAVAAECPIFLGNPHWSPAEWQQVFSIVRPDIIWSDLDKSILDTDITQSKTWSCVASDALRSRIAIPTGGSSGKIRFAVHSWETLTASVQGFQDYFQTDTINSVCVLPLYHVSGLMQFLRSFITDGTFIRLPSYKDILNFYLNQNLNKNLNPHIFRAIDSDQKQLRELGTIDLATYFISLVPTQLARLMQNPTAANWLSQFKTVLLGGAPAWPQLLDIARQQQINLAPTYGMTETASQVVTLKPSDFLSGNNSCGRVLPHAQIAICGEDDRQLDIGQVGMIKIRAQSLALGYYPGDTESQFSHNSGYFISDDLGFFDADGYLNIVGRRSDKIITGGENVFPAEVEAAIRTTGLVADVCTIALPDPDWGQAIAAIYVPKHLAVSADNLIEGLVNRLAKFKHPKYWVPVAQLPRNSQGKINRERLYQIAEAWRISQPEITNPNKYVVHQPTEASS